MRPLTIKTIRRDFPNKWLLIEVTDTKAGAPFKGILLNAGDKRQEVVGEIGRHRGKRLFFFFNGIAASPDTAFAL
jgi:hypothetical protein